MKLARLLLVSACCWLLASPAQAAAVEETRVAVAVGNNLGLSGEAPLEYAEEDARRFHELALELGGVEPERAYLLKGKTASEVLSTLAVVRGRLLELAARGPTSLLFYVSAHGDQESLHLSGTRLMLAELRAALAELPTRFRLIVLDACQTTAQVQNKGGAPGPDVPIAIDAQSATTGEVFLRSASPGEPAQEWGYLGGGLFTHHLLAALRGAADFDSDGSITLTEAYSYAFRHTVVDAAHASSRPQRPSFDFRFHGFGDWVVTQPARLSAAILLERGLLGRFLVVDRENRLVVEVEKSDEKEMSVALRPGWYRIVHPGSRAVEAADLNVLWGGTKSVRAQDFVPVQHWRTRLRGAEPIVLRPHRLRVGYGLSSGSVAGLGVQHWLELSHAWLGRRGFVFGALGGNLDSFQANAVQVEHREARARLGGGISLSLGVFRLLLGAETQLAHARQHLHERDSEEIARVFGLKSRSLNAFWAGLGGLLLAELAITERWFVAVEGNGGAQRLVGGNRGARPLYVQGRMSLGWSF